MKRRFVMAIFASITIVALVKVAFAEEQSSFVGDLPKVSPVPEDPSTIMIQMDDPRQQKREASSGTPRVMQPYTIVQAYPYRLPTASYPAPVTRPPRPSGQNCVKEFLVNQLRETNDNINRLLECIKKNQNCESSQPEATPDLSFKPPSEPNVYQPCKTEIERLAKPTPPSTPCEDQPETPKYTTPRKPITFRKEYIKEESEEVDTNRYSSAKRFPSNSCEQSQEIVTEKPTPKPTRKRCRKPTTTTTKKCGCRTSPRKSTTTTTTTTRKPSTKKIRSEECKCVYCVDDGTCAGGYD